MIYILDIILIAVSLSMDAFALSFSYGISKVNIKKVILTALVVGIFHFIMPVLGNFVGISLFKYTLIKPKVILFLVFLILSIDMFIHFFENKVVLRKLNIIGIILFAISVSLDSFTVGLGINYIYDNMYFAACIFAFISSFFTFLGFLAGNILSKKAGKYSFLLGSTFLFIYSLYILTN